jgi:hypothetical protein
VERRLVVELKAFDDTFGSPTACRTCGASIIWAELVSGKRHPFNAPRGERPVYLRTSQSDDRRLLGHIEAADSHFATCPDAKSWSKR